MNYYQDTKNNWFYNDKEKPVSGWYYDHIVVLEGSAAEMHGRPKGQAT